MIDFFSSVAIILVIDLILFYFLNKILISKILQGAKSWPWFCAITALLIPILSNAANQSPSFAFYLAVSYLIILNGFSSNYKDDSEIFNSVEILQKKAFRLSIIFSLIGYLSYAKIS